MILLGLLVVLTILFLTVLTVFFSIYHSAHLDNTKVVAERTKATFYDRNNEEVDSDYLNRYVHYEDINSNIINAFVALEDKRFFEHKGVDYYRTIGAIVKNVKNGYAKEGGSTITQQLAKNTHLSNEKTIIRKIQEMKIAKEIENNYKKEDILELYLNAIYYGNGIYGIDAACKKYFGKGPSDLSTPEAAILAGIVRNPKQYSPIDHPENAEKRMKLVLRLMREQGYLTENEYYDSLRYSYNKPEIQDNGSYYAAVISEASRLLHLSEPEVLRSEIKIETYMDPSIQDTLYTLISSGQYDVSCFNGTQSDCYCLIADNKIGGVVGYYSIGKTDVFDRRQPGSTIKPLLIYTPAFHTDKLTLADLVNDEKKDFNGYSPKNFDDAYNGLIDVETAILRSVNTVAVELYEKMNRSYCLSLLHQCGIPTDLKDDSALSLALGGMCYGVTGSELTEGYMTLANGGIHQPISFIRRILDQDGKILYEKTKATNRVFSEESTYVMTNALQTTARIGTAKKLSTIPFEIAAKTGTVGYDYGNTDAWCMSYSPDFTVCVRYGGENNKRENCIQTTGGGMPTILSAAIHRKIGSKDTYFDQSNGICYADIDCYAREKDGKIYLANENTPKQYRKTYCFTERTKPMETSPYFLTTDAEIIVETTEYGILIDYWAEFPYSYLLYRENIEDDTAQLIEMIDVDERMGFDVKKRTFDNPIKHGIYRYRLDKILAGVVIESIDSRPILWENSG